MKLRIFDSVKNLFAGRAIVLMYHRVAELGSDVWELAVSPERFEQHLKILQKFGNVVTLEQLANAVSSRRLRKNIIAITFDDGYADNFNAAKPLLEKYKIPATFFIASGQIESETEFWWDELERIFLFAGRLPSTFSKTINGHPIVSELRDEIYLTEKIRQKHRLWKAGTEEAPTIRAELYYKVWEQIKPLPFAEQYKYLQLIREWAGLPIASRLDYRTMSVNELKQLASGALFTIGAHTVTHPALAFHDVDFQKKEINENRQYLHEITGQKIDLLAYPYGNCNENTVQIVWDSGFKAAFTTEQKLLGPGSPIFSLGRFQVKNLTGTELKEQLRMWQSR